MPTEEVAAKLAAHKEGTKVAVLRVKRQDDSFKKIPSPFYCTLYLIIGTVLVEFFDSLLLNALSPHLAYPHLLLCDIIFMLLVIVPVFYYFGYRPMKLYDRQKNSAAEEIHYLSRQLIQAGDREKKLVVSDLYDQLGQSLAALQFSLESMKSTLDDPQVSALSQCDTLIKSVAEMGGQVRSMSRRLIPPQLENLGLVTTLEWAVRWFQQNDKRFSINLDTCHFSERLSADIELSLYRVFEEAMDNVVRHSAARQVQIVLRKDDAQVFLEIRDDGVGVDASVGGRDRLPRGIGLLKMRERIESLGGKFQFKSGAGQGGCVYASLPLSRRRQDEQG